MLSRILLLLMANNVVDFNVVVVVVKVIVNVLAIFNMVVVTLVKYC